MRIRFPHYCVTPSEFSRKVAKIRKDASPCQVRILFVIVRGPVTELQKQSKSPFVLYLRPIILSAKIVSWKNF